MHAVVVPFGCLAAGDWQLLAVQSPEHAESALALKASVSASRKVLHCALLVHPCSDRWLQGAPVLESNRQLSRYLQAAFRSHGSTATFPLPEFAASRDRCCDRAAQLIGAVTGLPN